MSIPMTNKLWKRSCGLSRWFCPEDVAVDAITVSDSPALINKMPVELLGEIFAWTLEDWRTMTDEEPKLLLEPLTISHVCAHWRSVSTSIPMLWATIWIDRPRAAHFPLVALWIKRSRNCPLSIYLRQTDPKSCLSHPTSAEHDLTDKILAVLVPQVHRWRAVHFDFRANAQESLLALPVDAAVALEHIALNVNSWDTTSAESLQSRLYSCPSLSSLHFMTGSKQLDHAAWKRLTHLKAEPECTLETCLSILASCSALSSAKLTCSAVPDWSHIPFHHSEPYLALPTLLDLSIVASRIDLAPLLDRLTLPALRALSLDYRHVPRAAPDAHALHNLLARSSCALKSFSLRETTRTCDAARHIAFLESPHICGAPLTHLALHVDISEDIIELLTWYDSGGGRFPHMRYLELRDGRWGEHIRDDTLVGMLCSRLLPVDPSGVSGPATLAAADLQLRLEGHACPVLPPDRSTEGFEMSPLRFLHLECLLINGPNPLTVLLCHRRSLWDIFLRTSVQRRLTAPYYDVVLGLHWAYHLRSRLFSLSQSIGPLDPRSCIPTLNSRYQLLFPPPQYVSSSSDHLPPPSLLAFVLSFSFCPSSLSSTELLSRTPRSSF